MDTRNYCIECDRPKPCICDLEGHEFDTSDYVVLKGSARLVDTNRYHVIPKDANEFSGQSKEKDESGFPEQIIVCRALGTDLIAAYKRIN